MNSANNEIRGVQEPTRWHCPPADTSSADEAIDFLRRLGFALFFWQEFLLRHIFGEKRNSAGMWKWVASTVGIVIPRQNGKTFLIDCIILVGLFLFGERIVLTAQNRDTANRSFLRIVALIEDPKFAFLRVQVKKVGKRGGTEFIALNNGGLFYVKTRGPDSARGLDKIDRLIMDEAYDVTEDDLAAVIPTVLASENPQVCYLSTPPRNAVSGEPFNRLRRRGHDKADGVAWFEWGVDPDKLDGPLDTADVRLWAIANPSLNLPGSNLTASNLAIMQGSMAGDKFATECLGVWPTRYANNVVDLAIWKNELADPNTAIVGDLALAVDATGSGSSAHCSIVAYGIRADGLGSYEIVENRRGNEWVVPRLLELVERHKPVAIGIDPKGPITSVILDLDKAGIKPPKNSDSPKLGDLAIPVGNDFAAACLQFADAVTQKSVRHPDDPLLNAAVVGVRTRKIGDDSWGWDRYRSDVDVSPVVAATLARWAYESRAHLVKREFDPAVWLF
ncbi:hypothetical protein V6U81_04365 [Micromonospora sp. CPCC 205711]|uniref:hypothetical protein n=1 Tax=Micromonospora sp. CPCC 205547 TaxID=3122400 RepID=UPI002FEFC7F2